MKNIRGAAKLMGMGDVELSQVAAGMVRIGDAEQPGYTEENLFYCTERCLMYIMAAAPRQKE